MKDFYPSIRESTGILFLQCSLPEKRLLGQRTAPTESDALRMGCQLESSPELVLFVLVWKAEL